MNHLITGGLILTIVAVAAVAKSPMVISQKGKIFRPGEVDLKVDDVIIVDNDDRVTHHVYVESPTFNFDSGEQPPGKRVPLKFTKAGTFEVMCEIHPKMKLVVNVR